MALFYVVLLTTTSNHVWFYLPFPKCRNSLDSQMVPFGLTRCASLLRTRLKVLIDGTCWTPCSSMCSDDSLGWKGHGAAAGASWSHRQLNCCSGCFLNRHLLVPCKMVACILDSHWTLLCLKEHVYLLNHALVFLKSVAHGDLSPAITSVGAEWETLPSASSSAEPAPARWEAHWLMYHKGVRGEEDTKYLVSLEISFIESLKVAVWWNLDFRLKQKAEPERFKFLGASYFRVTVGSAFQ